MASTFPQTLDTLSTTSADATTSAATHPALHNNVNDAVNKIEQEQRYQIGGNWKPVWAPTGALAETIPRFVATGGNVALATGQIRLAGGIVLRGGVQITSITVWSGATAAVTPTNQWFSIVQQSNRTALRSTVDDTTTAWAANSAKTLNLSTPYTPGSDVAIYIGVMVAAATPPSLSGVNLGTQLLINATPSLATLSTSGLTTPSADGTVFIAGSGNTSVTYAYVS